jgi:hypothetical protein
MKLTWRSKWFAALSGIAVCAAVLISFSKSSAVINRSPVGETFPTSRGESLEGKEVELPGDLSGAPAILILGYAQDAQFDADRWLFGLLQAETPAQILEVPTIPGMIPGWLSSRIDAGMRSGIPSEDWAVVVTMYGSDATKLVELTGNEGDRNVRVLLLDEAGRILWLHDRGFSAGKLLELDRAVRELVPSAG